MDTESLRRRLSVEEDRRTVCYLDSLGIPTIGVGFNLQRSDARRKLLALGYDLDAVLRGEPISEAAVDALLTDSIDEAIAAARQLVDGFDELAPSAQEVLVDMVFNMGPARVRQFHQMLAALEAHDYARAAAEMLDSLWARQVGDRARHLAELMRSASEDMA